MLACFHIWLLCNPSLAPHNEKADAFVKARDSSRIKFHVCKDQMLFLSRRLIASRQQIFFLQQYILHSLNNYFKMVAEIDRI